MPGVTMAVTRFASITGSLIMGPEAGYPFLPTIDSLKRCLSQIWENGKVTTKKKAKQWHWLMTANIKV